MATALPSESSLECPICREDFDDPKILPCTHLACKKCVLSWLCNSGGEGGCPLCRDPILPSNHSAQDDLVMLVDALPTNFAVMALVESQQVLTSPHECGLCDDVASTSYCLQCNIKLCKNCAKGHMKIPLTKQHVIEDLNKVTVKRLAETNRIICKVHPDRLGELYCPAHKEVICLMCLGTSHESCTGKKSIADAADKVRAEFKDRACALRQSEATIAQQIKNVKDAYKVVRKRVKDTFDDMQNTADTRKQELEREIQAQEDAAMTDIKSKETTRASLASNAKTLEHLVSTAPQAALLAMVADLTPRLDQLQSHRSHTATTTSGQLQFTVDDRTLKMLKSDISSLGHITIKLPASSTTATPTQSTSNACIPPPHPHSVAHTDEVIDTVDQVTIGPDQGEGELLEDEEGQMLINEFISTVSTLTTCRRSFAGYLKPLCEKLKHCQSPEIYASLVTALYEQCIYEPNFQYTGARALQVLCRELQGHPLFRNFKRDFLNKCQEDFERREQLIGSGRGGERNICAFALFMGELSLNVTAEARGQTEQLTFFPDALTDMLLTLVNHPSDATIKTACQLLELAGGSIEDAMLKQDRAKFNRVFEVLTVLKDSSRKLISKNIRCLIQFVLSQRHNNWGRSGQSSAALQYSGASNITECSRSEPVFNTDEDEEDYFPADYIPKTWQSPTNQERVAYPVPAIQKRKRNRNRNKKNKRTEK